MLKIKLFFLFVVLFLTINNVISKGVKIYHKTFLKKLRSVSIGILASGILNSNNIDIVNAFGPVEMTLSDITYKQVELCDGKKPIMPGQKAAEGLYPACVEVTAKINNPSEKTLKDVSIYGFVKVYHISYHIISYIIFKYTLYNAKK